jgi:hypothetical protein
MAENEPLSTDPEAPMGRPEWALPEGSSYTFAAPARSIGGTGEGNRQLWDGHIIDATLPLV